MNRSGRWLAASLCCLLGPVAMAAGSGDAAASPCDFFCYMTEANEASLVMLTQDKLVPPELARQIAAAIDQIAVEQERPGAARWTNYLDFEKRLLEVAGPEASRLHTGRSRQDLHETIRRMLMRDAFLDTFGTLLGARAALLDLAQRNVHTVIPAYTHGVQAQPTTLAHYLLAFAAALGRDADRLREFYPRLNQSPLGAAALGTSGFRLDRALLARLLGFDRPVENSYDANLVSSADVKIEFADVLANSAVHVGQFTQDLHAQYREPRPWLEVAAGTTDVSSIMPQKRNPRPVDRLRSLATDVVADAQAVTLAAHNTNTGMNDYRGTTPLFTTTDDAMAMYRAWAKLLAGLQVDPVAALQVLNRDYATMTEVADTLLRDAGIPFRTAHHYASELTTYGRAHDKRPNELTDADLKRIYREAVGGRLPVPVATLRKAMDPVAMVDNRQGLGGPQPAEVERMLVEQRARLADEHAWLQASRQHLESARRDLQAGFAAIERPD